MPTEVRVDPYHWLKGESRWDRLGPFYEGDPDMERGTPTHTHVWGANFGAHAYDFALPEGAWINAMVSARLSSEHPWYSSPLNHFSDATLVLNGRDYPSKRVIPDNGSGRFYTWRINPHDLRQGSNVLKLGVKKNATYRNGLCIYRRALFPDQTDCAIVIRISTAEDLEGY